jgi:hypothetical protein
MALRSLTLSAVRAMTEKQRTRYFETYAGYYADSPNFPYAIRVGSKTLFSNDTFLLRQKFDKLVGEGK